MISSVLIALENGFKVMRSNSRMVLVGVLVFVFPLLFVWISQSFFTTAYDNINTTEKRQVSLLHDSITTTLKAVSNKEEVLPALINVFTAENPEITKIRVVDEVEGSFKILYANDRSLVGNLEKSDELYRVLPLSAENSSFIVESVLNGARTWQTFRSVTVEGEKLIVFTEHNFTVIDSVMAARRQYSYYGLTVIFLFLMALAYWLNRQTNWQHRHDVLQQQLHERDLFSNMIAHEFRTPLTVIKGYASFLEDSETISTEDKRFANTIKVSAERLVLLVNDFLEVARLQSGKLIVKRESVDLRTVLTQVASNLQSLAGEKGLTLIDARSSVPVFMDTDAARMIQILTNIVTNSIKYTDSGTITLECQQRKGKVSIYIKDTGTGISAEDQQKLFTPFTRVGGVDKTTTTGTGLGMWITQQLVTLLGGTIGVESIKGIGTHIIITFKPTAKD